MGIGQVPGPTNDLGSPLVIDDGTTPRTESPLPGPIGLDARGGGGARPTQATMAEQIVTYPRRHRGQRVGDGECFTLADRALRTSGAKSAADYGAVAPDVDYIWGTSVQLSDLQPGDVIQFRNYRYEREVETRHPNGSVETNTDFQERPHHTAIVEQVGANGEVTVLEQNSPVGSAVARTQLFLSNRQQSSSGGKTSITVSGTVWFYRPQLR
jgi:hypothetical protein